MKALFSPLSRYGAFLVALLFFFVSSCKGPQGDLGPAGPTGSMGAAGTNGTNGTTGAVGTAGTTGPAGTNGTNGTNGAIGATGAQGPTGNANVVYTEWKSPTWDGNFSRANDNTSVSLTNLNNAYPLFTKEAIDKSLVYVYFKFGQSLFDATTGDFKLFERIIESSTGNGGVKIPSRTTNKSEDFVRYFVNHDFLGENYLKFNLVLFTNVFDGSQNKTVAIPDLANQPAQFYKDMVKDLPQYRVVIVNGNVKAGRLAAVDFKDYAAVKRAFNIPD